MEKQEVKLVVLFGNEGGAGSAASAGASVR